MVWPELVLVRLVFYHKPWCDVMNRVFWRVDHCGKNPRWVEFVCRSPPLKRLHRKPSKWEALFVSRCCPRRQSFKQFYAFFVLFCFWRTPLFHINKYFCVHLRYRVCCPCRRQRTTICVPLLFLFSGALLWTSAYFMLVFQVLFLCMCAWAYVGFRWDVFFLAVFFFLWFCFSPQNVSPRSHRPVIWLANRWAVWYPVKYNQLKF